MGCLRVLADKYFLDHFEIIRLLCLVSWALVRSLRPNGHHVLNDIISNPHRCLFHALGCNGTRCFVTTSQCSHPIEARNQSLEKINLSYYILVLGC